MEEDTPLDALGALSELSRRLPSTNLSKFLTDYTQRPTAAKLALVFEELSDKPNKDVKFSLLLHECDRKVNEMNFVEAGHIVSSAGKIYGYKVDDLHAEVVNYNSQLKDTIPEGNENDKEDNPAPKERKSRKIIRANLQGARKIDFVLPKPQKKSREKKKITPKSSDTVETEILNLKEYRKHIQENKSNDYFIKQAEFAHPKNLYEFSVMPDIDKEDQPDSKRNYALFTKMFDLETLTLEPDLKVRFHKMQEGDDPWLAYSLDAILQEDINEASDLFEDNFKDENLVEDAEGIEDVVLEMDKSYEPSMVDSAYCSQASRCLSNVESCQESELDGSLMTSNLLSQESVLDGSLSTSDLLSSTKILDSSNDQTLDSSHVPKDCQESVSLEEGSQQDSGIKDQESILEESLNTSNLLSSTKLLVPGECDAGESGAVEGESASIGKESLLDDKEPTELGTQVESQESILGEMETSEGNLLISTVQADSTGLNLESPEKSALEPTELGTQLGSQENILGKSMEASEGNLLSVSADSTGLNIESPEKSSLESTPVEFQESILGESMEASGGNLLASAVQTDSTALNLDSSEKSALAESSEKSPLEESSEKSALEESSNLLQSTETKMPEILSVITIPAPLGSDERDECIDSPDLIEPLHRSELPHHLKKALDIENGPSALLEDTLRPLTITFERRSSMDNESGIGSSGRFSSCDSRSPSPFPVSALRATIINNVMPKLRKIVAPGKRKRPSNCFKVIIPPELMNKRQKRDQVSLGVNDGDTFNADGTDGLVGFQGRRDVFVKVPTKRQLPRDSLFETPPKMPGDRYLLSPSLTPVPFFDLDEHFSDYHPNEVHGEDSGNEEPTNSGEIKKETEPESSVTVPEKEDEPLPSLQTLEKESSQNESLEVSATQPFEAEKGEPLTGTTSDEAMSTLSAEEGKKSTEEVEGGEPTVGSAFPEKAPGVEPSASTTTGEGEPSVETTSPENMPCVEPSASTRTEEGDPSVEITSPENTPSVEPSALTTTGEGEPSVETTPSDVDSSALPILAEGEGTSPVTTPNAEPSTLMTMAEGENPSETTFPVTTTSEKTSESTPLVEKEELTEEPMEANPLIQKEEPEMITLESTAKRVIYSLKLSDDNFEKLLEENLDLLQKLYSEELKDPKLMERIRQAEERSKFDIEESCFRIMDKFPKTDDPLLQKPVLSLEEIMKDEDKTFVSKVILSILIMTNKTSVSLTKPLHYDENQPFAWSDIMVTLLSRKRSLISAQEAYAEFQHKKSAPSTSTSTKPSTSEKPTTKRPPPDITVSPPKVRRTKTVEKRRAVRPSATSSSLNQSSPFTPHSPLDMDSGYDNDTLSETSGSISNSNFDNCNWNTNESRRQVTSPSITSLEDWE